MERKLGESNQSIKAMNKLRYESPLVAESSFSRFGHHLEEIPAFYSLIFYLKEAKNNHLAKPTPQKGDNIGREDNVNINANSLSASDSHFFLQGETFFKQREESFDCLPHLVDLFESFSGSKKLHLLREAMVSTDIERLSVFSLPAAAFEETVTFLPDKRAAKFHPFSSFLFSPIDKFFACWTEHLSLWGNGQLREQSGVFRVSRIRSDKGLNFLFLRKGDIVQAIIAGISDGLAYGDFLQSALEKRFKESSVIGFSRSYFNRGGKGKVRRDDRGMELISEEEGVLVFHSPASILVGRRFLIGVSRDVGGIYSEGSFSFPFENESLGNQCFQNLFESFLPNSFYKDSESVMRRGPAVGESAKIAQTSVETQFSGEVSLGAGFSKGNQEQGLEEANWVESFSSQRSLWDKGSDKRKIDGGENLLQGVILRDILGDDPISKTELPFHDCFSLGEVKKNKYTRYLFKYQYFN